jgi:hypothetical protein
MKGHTEVKSRQVTGSDQCGEGKVPSLEQSGSGEATMHDEPSRGTKFDDPGPDVCGFRNMAEQNEAFATGRSKLQYSDSKHNLIPSYAVDVAPWHQPLPHIRWEAEREFFFLAGLMTQAARSIGSTLRWGGNWDMDQDFYDSNVPFDLVHFELYVG